MMLYHIDGLQMYPSSSIVFDKAEGNLGSGAPGPVLGVSP